LEAGAQSESSSGHQNRHGNNFRREAKRKLVYCNYFDVSVDLSSWLQILNILASSRVAVRNRKPLNEFIQDLVKPGHDFCSDYDEHRIGINTIKGNLPAGASDVERPDIIIAKHELDFARSAIDDTPIWPLVIHKALEAIEKETGPDSTLLVKMGRREETFDCDKDGLAYLCKVSDMVSRLTGVRLHSIEPTLMEDTPQDKVDIERILNGATGGIGIVFDKQAPRFLMQTSIDNTGREYKQKAFNDVQLDIEKWGERDETNYNVHGFGTGTFNYASIMDYHGGEHRDVRLVVPY
jgi:hypothetical protein